MATERSKLVEKDGGGGSAVGAPDRLRAEALAALRAGEFGRTEDLLARGNLTMAELTQELLVHQAELELQAEDLRDRSLRHQIARDRFAQFFEELPQPALVVAVEDGIIQSANDRARQLFGLRSYPDSTTPMRRLGARAADRDAITGALMQTAGQGRAKLLDQALVTGNRITIWAELHFQRIQDESDARILVVLNDQTELRTRLQQLDRIERRTKAVAGLLRLSSDPTLSAQDVLDAVPDILERGFPPDCSVGARVTHAGRSHFGRNWHASPQPGVAEHTLSLTPLGEIAFQHPGPRGETDAETRRWQEDYDGFTRRRLAEELERSLRTLALREEVRRSERDKVLGQIAGGIAHEFNNQLAAIQGNAELLQALREAEGEEAEILESILQATRNAAKLTGHLLSYAERQTMRVRVFSLRGFLDDRRVILKSALRNVPRIGFEIVMPDEDAELKLDPLQLETALVNVLSNARLAMPEGGNVRLRAAILRPGDPAIPETIDTGSDCLALTVADTGAGMDPDTLRYATEPFFTTRPIGAGVGLGLSMVSGFVAQSHGALALQSSPGGGTRVTLYFPCTRVGA